MKYISKITLGLILCTGFITACNDDNETGASNGITIDREEIVIGPEGGTEKIAVSAGTNWTASSSQPWISISPANGSGSADCSLAIDSTLENTVRETQVRFVAENQEPKLISVIQFGYGKQIKIKEPNIEIESSSVYDKRYFETTISTNVNFKISEVEYDFANKESMTEEEEIELENEKYDWLHTNDNKDLDKIDLGVDLDRKARPRSIKVRIRWDMNTAPYNRIAKIHLVPTDTNDQLVDDNGNNIDDVVLTITQKAALKITDDRAGDSLAIVTINEKIQSMISFETSENMRNWEGVTLWEATDKLPNNDQAAIGRIRSVQFTMFDLKDGEIFPKEIRHLKYLESLTLQTNSNWQIRGNVKLCDEICDLENLKELIVYAYGITELPNNFDKLGSHLETLGLASNGFATLSYLIGETGVLKKNNFTALRALSLTGCRRIDTIKDLSKIGDTYKDPGLHINLNDTQEKAAFIYLLTWDKLRELSLSYNLIEGTLPSDDEMLSHMDIKYYRPEDFFKGEANSSDYLDKISSDTCSWLLSNNNPVTYKYQTDKDNVFTFENVTGQSIPRVLPFARRFTLNLNFLTGELPKWILFHPYFVEWGPEILIFTQEENGYNSKGEKVGFSNIDATKFDYKYYYGDKALDYTPGTPVIENGVAYPLYYKRYVAN